MQSSLPILEYLNMLQGILGEELMLNRLIQLGQKSTPELSE
jgi:hypothetical protein